jgi:[NiFe] hydrogenase assembly HybE family chaperone
MDDAARLAECAGLAERLEAYFRAVHAGAMRDVPICNERLAVASAGFRPWNGWAIGVLVTPWFMNVIAAPLFGAPEVATAPGGSQNLALPAGEIDCLAAELDSFGRLLMCSLFSPMQDFVDQEAVMATAKAALDLLLTPPLPPPAPEAARMDRRAFFRGGAPTRGVSP